MKILFLQGDFPPYSLGGAGVVAFNLAKALQKKGHNVFVITTTPKKNQEIEKEYLGLKIYQIYSNYHERWSAYLSLYNPKTIKEVKKIIKQINPDIVHAHNVHYHLSYYCLKIARKYSKAVFLTVHDAMLFHYGKLVEFVDPNDLSIPKTFNYKITPWQQIKRFKKRYNPFRNIIIRHYLKYVDKIFAVSYVLKDALNQNDIENVEVIHNGIDAVQWQIDNEKLKNFKKEYNLFNKKIVFFAGRLSSLKGGEVIIKAMKIITEQIPDTLLLVAGRKDDYTDRMLRLAKEQNLSIVLTGWIENDDLINAYHSSNVVVTPSIYLDPFNLINIEAMIAKKPVVGTCFGGTSEIVVDNQTGYIINPSNTQTMAEKIIDLLKHPDKAKQFGENGFQRVKQNFSIEKQIRETLEWYKKYV